MALTIASLNVRGLRDNVKRREVLIGYEQKTFQFICYKKFIVPKTLISMWSAEWGYQTIFSTYESNKAGVCILFNNQLYFI